MMTYLYLSNQKKQLKREVKWEIIEGIDKSELVFIKLTKAEAKEKLEWEHSKEFEFQGEMYDVVEFEETADSVKYWCWWDDEETALNENLAQVLNNLLGNDPDKKEKEEKLITFYQSLFSEKIFQWHTIQFASILNQLSNYQFSSKTHIDKVSTPPPKLII
jgi:hypothetical protein